MHNTYTIRSGMVPGVQKVGVAHSIASYAEKCESDEKVLKRAHFVLGDLGHFEFEYRICT